MLRAKNCGARRWLGGTTPVINVYQMLFWTSAFQKERKARVLNVVFTGLHRAQCSRVEFWTLDYETLGS